MSLPIRLRCDMLWTMPKGSNGSLATTRPSKLMYEGGGGVHEGGVHEGGGAWGRGRGAWGRGRGCMREGEGLKRSMNAHVCTQNTYMPVQMCTHSHLHCIKHAEKCSESEAYHQYRLHPYLWNEALIHPMTGFQYITIPLKGPCSRSLTALQLSLLKHLTSDKHRLM